MIQKFKRKTIFILTMIFWIMLIGILLAVNISNYKSNESETRKILSTQEKILEFENIRNPKPFNDNEQKTSRIYSVTVTKDEKYEVVFSNEGSGYSEEDLIKIAKDIFHEKNDEGVLNHFRYKTADIGTGIMISFIDYTIWEHQQYRMMVYSILIGLFGMIILFFVAFFLTGWLVKPIITAFNKQKQFISDAGHELKTPLTVMKSSLDMLEGEYGENKYFEYIREENSRMTILIHELLSLSSLEKEVKMPKFEKIDLSRILEGSCLPFECLAFENGILLELQIQHEVYILGAEKQIRQMIEVLVDNAIKHTYKNGSVIVRLDKERGKAILQVKNQGEPIPENEQSKIFDRFYRVDKARNRKEGRYGLGLAIASSIAEDHKSIISVECKDNWTIFCVKFN